MQTVINTQVLNMIFGNDYRQATGTLSGTVKVQK